MPVSLPAPKAEIQTDPLIYGYAASPSAAADESEPVAALYTEHWPAIYRFLRTRMPRASDADVEDLTADVFVKVARFSGRYEDRGRPLAWLREIARNALLDDRRAAHARPRSVEIVNDAPAGRATLDAGSARHDLALDVARAVARLPERQRIAIVDRYWAGGTAADTALLMGTTEDAVKKLLWWGKRRLKRELEAIGWTAA